MKMLLYICVVINHSNNLKFTVMKFSATHYSELKQAIINCDIDIAQSIENYKNKGLSTQRLLWDIFWCSNYSKNDSFRSAHYKDSHIETALKNIVSELKK